MAEPTPRAPAAPAPGDPAAGPVVVFAGPSLAPLTPRQRRDLARRVRLEPPARRGDILAVLAHRPRALVLIDGYYYNAPAVTHKELLRALESGVRVIGAASLGALRAAELATLGMEGVGQVFRWLRAGLIEGDDEVAVLHLDERRDFRPLTIALVEVRWAVARLAEEGRLTHEAGRRLVERLADLPFVDRTPSRVGDLAARTAGAAGRLALERALAADSLKLRDARDALRRAQADRAGVSRPPPPGPVTVFLSYDQERYLRPAAPHPAAQSPTYLAAWQATRVLHPGVAAFVERLRLRFLLAGAARRAGLEAAPRTVADLSARFARDLEHQGRDLPLAPRDLAEEALEQALACAARRHLGGRARAFGELATTLGISGDAADRDLVELTATQHGLLPDWLLLRAFLVSRLLPRALALAVAADEVGRCLERWSGGARIAESDLHRLAARLWGCSAQEVPREGGRRGLLVSDGLAPGLREALERVAAAELLRRPINGYPGARRALLGTPLTYPLPLPRRLRPARRAAAERARGSRSRTPR